MELRAIVHIHVCEFGTLTNDGVNSYLHMGDRIDYLKFKDLLSSLESSDRLVRFRLEGEGWTEFSHVILVSQTAMILQENGSRRMIMNLRRVTEFELREEFRDFGAGKIVGVEN